MIMKIKTYINLDRIRYCFLLIHVLCLSLIILTIQCQKVKSPEVSVYVSSQDGDRLMKYPDTLFEDAKELGLPVIKIDENTRFQKINGFGASFNEAGMICLNSLTSEVKENVLKMLFDSMSGAGYTLMKSPIGATDFASAGAWYTYNDTPDDTLMKSFSVERDLAPNGLITFIKAAQKYGQFEIQSPMDFGPDWMYYGMKDWKERDIKPQNYNALASYYLKYIQAYAANGITINYLSLFNEPGIYSNVPFNTIGLLIKNHVAPLFASQRISTKILLGETNTSAHAAKEFPALLEDKDISKNIYALAYHGYLWADGMKDVANLHNKYPKIPIWQTEICYAMTLDWNDLPPQVPHKMPIYDFGDGEWWGNVIMNDMKNSVSAWIYWNMILDEDGGPCLESPEHGDPKINTQHPVVIIDRKTNLVTYTGLYYYLAHFSKFIRPGAYRIYSDGQVKNLNFAAFVNPDGNIILNIINNGVETTCNVKWQNKIFVQKLKSHSITTLKWFSGGNNPVR